ncbi:hypothetical protein CsSME_00036134 [Camellia sinensis var. sinensis]
MQRRGLNELVEILPLKNCQIMNKYEDEVESGNPRKKKGKLQKRLWTAGSDKASRQPNMGNTNTSGNNLSSIQEMLQEFLQQQQRIEMLWRESIERHNYERQMFEQE